MEPARWSVWHLPAALVPMNYIEQVQAAGAVAVLIPPDPALVGDPGRVLDRLDGLLLVGGADVGAGAYGAEPHPLNDAPIPLRDAVETALVRAAVERGLPVLGICRGAQIINVAGGGTLRQHLPDELGHEEHRREIGRFDGNEHDVRVEEGSRAFEATGEVVHRVVSHHHQAIDAPGRGLRVTARAVDDDLPEAVEIDRSRLGPRACSGTRRPIRGATSSPPSSGRRGTRGARAWIGKKGATSRSPPLTRTNGADPVGSALHPARTPSLDIGWGQGLGRASSLGGAGLLPSSGAGVLHSSPYTGGWDRGGPRWRSRSGTTRASRWRDARSTEVRSCAPSPAR